MRLATSRKLCSAASEREVVELVREYISSWAPAELAALPEHCRPGKMRDAEDIADCAIALTRARISLTDPDPLLTEMEGFFAQACGHISQLDRGVSPGGRKGQSPPAR